MITCANRAGTGLIATTCRLIGILQSRGKWRPRFAWIRMITLERIATVVGSTARAMLV